MGLFHLSVWTTASEWNTISVMMMMMMMINVSTIPVNHEVRELQNTAIFTLQM
jgi:hypothetical protein